MSSEWICLKNDADDFTKAWTLQIFQTGGLYLESPLHLHVREDLMKEVFDLQYGKCRIQCWGGLTYT